MRQHSEDRLEQSPPAAAQSQSARILPFERPQSDLQRAVQLRAQEAMDIERDREREANKPAPLRWLIIFAIALIPVILIFGAVDGFLRAFYKVNETYNSMPAPSANETQPVPELTTSEPGVIILQPYDQLPPASERSSTPSEPEPVRANAP